MNPSNFEPILGEPWVAIPPSKFFSKHTKQDEISFNQQLRQTEKYHFYQLAYDFLNENRIIGDYHEFGCHRCRTFRMALSEAKRHGMDQTKFYAYDSFEGLPQTTSTPSQETWSAGALKTEETEFLNLIENHGIYIDSVKTIRGMYDQTLSRELSKELSSKASFICVDCDLYESAKPVFDYIPDLIQDGTVLYIDDYYTGYKGDPRKGVARAFSESSLNDHFLLTPFRQIGWWGKSFLLHRK